MLKSFRNIKFYQKTWDLAHQLKVLNKENLSASSNLLEVQIKDQMDIERIQFPLSTPLKLKDGMQKSSSSKIIGLQKFLAMSIRDFLVISEE